VKHQRLVAQSGELVEGKALRAEVRHEGREAENTVGNFRDFGFHGCSPEGVNFNEQACAMKWRACQYSLHMLVQ
jgi:hypothetical protein